MVKRFCNIALLLTGTIIGLFGPNLASAQQTPQDTMDASSGDVSTPETSLTKGSWKRPYLEWATLGIGGGTHGAAVGGQFFGFRMPHLSVTLVDMTYGFAAPARWADREYAASRKVFMAWGTTVAYPLILDSAGRHELRFGITPEFHINSHGNYDLPGDCPNGEWLCSPAHVQSMVGFAIAPRIEYQYRITDVVAFHLGLSAHISIAGASSCGWFCEVTETEYPWPGAFLTVGFRFGTPWFGKN